MHFEREFGFVLALAIILITAASGCSGSSKTTTDEDSGVSSQDVVATYAGQTLTVSDFEDRYATSVGGREAAVNDSLPEYEDFLERYVDFRLKVIDAYAAGVDKDSSLVAELEQYRSQLARPYLVNKEILESQVHDLYEKQQLEITASHILVRVPGSGTPADTLQAYEKIQTLRDSVLTGVDFNDIAERNSEDPSARRNRGSLGTFSGGRMILAFETRAYNTPPGEMSEIFSTQYGYHLLFVHERGPRAPEISASHILIRAADDDTTAAWAKVQEVQAALDSGASFADVATRYSEDPGSAKEGGSLGFFGRGRMVGEFEVAAFSLEEVGDRSDWFRTQFGYHIIQLDDKGHMPTFDEAYDDLRSLAQRLPRFKAAERELGLKYREILGSGVDTVAIDRLISEIPPDSVMYFVAIKQWDDSSSTTQIAHVGPQSYTLRDFLNYGMTKRGGAPPASGKNQMFELLDDMLDEKALDVATATLEDRDSTFAALMMEYRDGILLFRVMEDSVWNKAASDSTGLSGHYLANASAYTFPERRRVLSFSAANDSLLEVVSAGYQETPLTGSSNSLMMRAFESIPPS
ncbi:peptidylprolyl isomerase [Bacteroidota bacterium]